MISSVFDPPGLGHAGASFPLSLPSLSSARPPSPMGYCAVSPSRHFSVPPAVSALTPGCISPQLSLTRDRNSVKSNMRKKGHFAPSESPLAPVKQHVHYSEGSLIAHAKRNLICQEERLFETGAFFDRPDFIFLEGYLLLVPLFVVVALFLQGAVCASSSPIPPDIFEGPRVLPSGRGSPYPPLLPTGSLSTSIPSSPLAASRAAGHAPFYFSASVRAIPV